MGDCGQRAGVGQTGITDKTGSAATLATFVYAFDAQDRVSSETIETLFKRDGWDAFYKRYPGSGGYVIVSAVGFNRGKSQAIVYTGSVCGNLCGRWSFHLLEKVDGNWKQATGVTCVSVS